MTEPAPAATVVLLRDGAAGLEVLLLRRNSKLAFHGGSWVFPGGRVDPDDVRDDGDVGAARRAAVREACEEAGVAVDPDALLLFSHWTTPEEMPRRFSTWFFVGPAGEGAVSVDGGEIDDHAWHTPASALAARAAGEIELPPPTFVTLTTLAVHDRVADALHALSDHEPVVFVPRPVGSEDGLAMLYPGDAGWEARDPSVPGPRHRLLILPSGWQYLRNTD